MDEILKGVITNTPNLVGLVVLARVLYQIYMRQLETYEKLLSKYHELVIILSENRKITPQQFDALMAHDNTK